MEQEFIAYLKSKKIDPEGLRQNEPDVYIEFMEEFKHLHPKSFTMQKLFLINILRRKYPYKEVEQQGSVKQVESAKQPAISATGGGAAAKPKIKPAVRPKGSTRPVIKPKVSVKPLVPEAGEVAKIKPDEKNEGEEKVKKPMVKKPVIKPRVPKPKKEE